MFCLVYDELRVPSILALKNIIPSDKLWFPVLTNKGQEGFKFVVSNQPPSIPSVLSSEKGIIVINVSSCNVK